MSKKKPAGKAPAFQLYASDFYMDTISWTDEMVGLHIRLLCQQWINDFIPVGEDGCPINLSENQRSVFDKIKHKYIDGKKGQILNKKLNDVKKKRDEFVKEARKSGRDGASKRWGKDRVPHKNPNGVEIALQSSSSTTINSSSGITNIWEYFKFHTTGIPDDVLRTEILKYRAKYPGQDDPASNSNLMQAWCSNIKYKSAIPEGMTEAEYRYRKSIS